MTLRRAKTAPWALGWTVFAAGCGGRPAPAPAPVVQHARPDAPQPAALTRSAQPGRPVVPPAVARLAGLMPLRATGVEAFRQRFPTFDGRGVLIAVLDGGIDAGLPGMRTTTTGERKLLELRDFSGEGRIALSPVVADGDTVRIAGRALSGMGRVARLAVPPYYGGVLREDELGASAAADVNGDGDRSDAFPLLVARASDGWFLTTDTDGDGALEDERPVHDYAQGGETLTYGSAPMTLAVNIAESTGRPVVDLFFDSSSHGTHVAGIAAGHNLFGVAGFDGVAPGAQLLGLKIADNRWGKISVSGSMVRAMEYAAAFAARRSLPLVINLSYGVGNEVEGAAAIDSLLDAFAERHPGVLVVVSGGNDGPGMSTVGFPASADLALSVCALVPGVFARAPDPAVPPAPDVLGWWSARGGEVAKPDLCAPGVAFSNVPPWQTGEEIAGGTSQAAPHVAGMAAVLLSAVGRDARRVRAIDLKRALLATARPLAGATALDQGFGVPDVAAAFDWLGAGHQAGIYTVSALPDGGNTSRSQAAYRRAGLASSADTVQRFQIATVGGQAAARLLLSSDADWLKTPAELLLSGQPAFVTLTYDASKLTSPGMHVGTVWARAASDTLAGPVFRLINTVVVPHDLATPFSAARTLEAGAVDRFFFRVPPDAGGLRVDLSAAAGPSGVLYLFEPSGQPYRATSGMEAISADTGVTLMVRGEDLVPGVYEAVVVAPPGAAAAYRLSAALPSVAVRAIGTGPSAVLVNRAADTSRVNVTAWITGAAQDLRLSGGAQPASLELAVPPWAVRLVLDISLPDELWNQVTDVGVLVRDAAGRELSERPMEYAFGRRTITLDSTSRSGPLTIRVLPAFARPAAATAWSGAVRAVFLRPDSVSLDVLGMGAVGRVVMPPGGTAGLQFAPLPEDTSVPEGYSPLVEVIAAPGKGIGASRQAAVAVPSGASP